MSRMQARMLPGGRRLHLNDGPIDLIISAEGGFEDVDRAYVAAQSRFAMVLDELLAAPPPAQWGRPFSDFQDRRLALLNGEPGAPGTMWPGDLIRALAGAVDDRDTDRRVVAQQAELRPQLVAHRHAHRVELRGAVQRQPQHVADALRQDERLAAGQWRRVRHRGRLDHAPDEVGQRLPREPLQVRMGAHEESRRRAPVGSQRRHGNRAGRA